VVERRREI